VSQEKKLADYATGTYFIHPKLIEEMQQLQRQKRQLAKQQEGDPSEQSIELILPHGLEQEKQAIHIKPDLSDTTTSHTNTVQAQPTNK
jgi:hypothetical protein